MQGSAAPVPCKNNILWTIFLRGRRNIYKSNVIIAYIFHARKEYVIFLSLLTKKFYLLHNKKLDNYTIKLKKGLPKQSLWGVD